MIEDKAKQAAAARAQLQQALLACANAVAAAAEVMTASAVVLAEASEREQVATLNYVSELEKRLNLQHMVS